MTVTVNGTVNKYDQCKFDGDEHGMCKRVLVQ